MAGVCWAGRARLLLVVVAVLAPLPAAAQTPPLRRSIVNPDFPCGIPYGPNGEVPVTSRPKRQIIFPDEENYATYLGQLFLRDGSSINPRESEASGEGQVLTDAFCGAAVISDRFLVTAAHCAVNEKNPISSVRLGDIDLNKDNEANSKPKDYDIKQIILHPGYRGNTTVRHYDLALLQTYDIIEFNDVVFPYCIPKASPPPGTIVTASGYGLYNATSASQHVLEANFTIIDTKECEDIYIKNFQDDALRLKYPNLLQNTDIICALDDVSDACQGDSGGPVIWKKDGKEYLAGLVSAGANCRGNFKSVLPGLYMSTAVHADFISAVVFSPDLTS
ncbi:serine protease persephone-like [Eriocheir sinensis]|uniref:serine protease persephone-like n=1 Tax=Eriocheir sinensis TaxID=95602 RepID=UPI0021CA10E2|nr:serine protease persephone-like [Eriocheir sinensis]